MRPDARPTLDGRDATALVSVIQGRLPAYVPGWAVRNSGPGRALLEAYGRQLQALVQRLEQAPGKAELAFLDLLGVSLLPGFARGGARRLPHRCPASATATFLPSRASARACQAKTNRSSFKPRRASPWPRPGSPRSSRSGPAAMPTPTTAPTPLPAARSPCSIPSRPVIHELDLAHDLCAPPVPQPSELRFELTTPGQRAPGHQLGILGR